MLFHILVLYFQTRVVFDSSLVNFLLFEKFTEQNDKIPTGSITLGR